MLLEVVGLLLRCPLTEGNASLVENADFMVGYYLRRASLPFCRRKLRVGTRMLAVQPVDDESRFLRDQKCVGSS